MPVPPTTPRFRDRWGPALVFSRSCSESPIRMRLQWATAQQPRQQRHRVRPKQNMTGCLGQEGQIIWVTLQLQRGLGRSSDLPTGSVTVSYTGQAALQSGGPKRVSLAKDSAAPNRESKVLTKPREDCVSELSGAHNHPLPSLPWVPMTPSNHKVSLPEPSALVLWAVGSWPCHHGPQKVSRHTPEE